MKEEFFDCILVIFYREQKMSPGELKAWKFHPTTHWNPNIYDL